MSNFGVNPSSPKNEDEKKQNSMLDFLGLNEELDTPIPSPEPPEKQQMEDENNEIPKNEAEVIVANSRQEISNVASYGSEESDKEMDEERAKEIRKSLKDLFFTLGMSLRTQLTGIDAEMFCIKREIVEMTANNVATSDEKYRELDAQLAQCGKERNAIAASIERLKPMYMDPDSYDTRDLKDEWEFFKKILQHEWCEVRVFSGLNKDAISNTKRLFGEMVLADIPNEAQQKCYLLLEEFLSWAQLEIDKLHRKIKKLDTDLETAKNHVRDIQREIRDYEDNELDTYEKLLHRKTFREQPSTSRITRKLFKSANKQERLSLENLSVLSREITQLKQKIEQLKEKMEEIHDGNYFQNKQDLSEAEKLLGDKEFLFKKEVRTRKDEKAFSIYQERFDEYENKKNVLLKEALQEQKNVLENRSFSLDFICKRLAACALIIQRFEVYISDVASELLADEYIYDILEDLEGIKLGDGLTGFYSDDHWKEIEAIKALVRERK